MNKKCQVFTPRNYVKKLLDHINYQENLYGKKILENSCGSGNILIQIVQRYIDDCKKKNFSQKSIELGLEQDIYGIEIDIEQYNICIENLNNLLKHNGLNNIKWNIFNEDYLKWDRIEKFDFIVGNPPYITYLEIKNLDKIYLKNRFISCKKGKFDYCYAFIEKSISDLNDSGKISYLIPSSIFKTVFGNSLREIMKPYILKIEDYTQQNVFDKALIKSSIILLSKIREKNILEYNDITTGKHEMINVDTLENKWIFDNENFNYSKKFGDYFQVSHVIATLLNEAYVLKEDDYRETKDYYISKECYIEKAIVKKTVSPRSLRYNKIEKIIFPYNYENEKVIRLSESEFINKYPGAFKYLSLFREKLENRKKDKNTEWFEYGRSQALSKIYTDKLLISTIITEKPVLYYLSKDCIPYAGMYIIPRKKNNEYSLSDAKKILESEKFLEYIMRIGIHISGTSLRITSKDIENYHFMEG